MVINKPVVTRLAPYGKELSLKLASGNKPRLGVWLFIGKKAWREAKRHQLMGKSVLVLPENKAPEHYIWPVQEQVVLILDLEPTGSNEVLLKRLAFQLLQDGATHVLLNPANDAPIVLFHRDELPAHREGGAT